MDPGKRGHAGHLSRLRSLTQRSDTAWVSGKPAPKPKPEADDDGDDRLVLAATLFVGLVGLLTFSLPFLVAGLLRWLIGPRLKRIEAASVATVSFVYLGVSAREWLADHFRWAGTVVGLRDGSYLSAPWLAWAALAVGLYSITCVLTGTRAAAWSIGRIAKYNPLHKEPEPDTILPSQAQKAAAAEAVVALPTVGTANVPGGDQVGTRRFPIGLDNKLQPVSIGEYEIKTHMLLFGATGAGKTEAIKAIAGGLLDLGWDGLIVDLKEDAQTGGLLDWCDSYAAHHAIPFQQFRISDPNPGFWFSPLYGMGPDEARDTILASQTFEAAYYRALNEKQLGQLIQLLYAANTVDPVRYPSPTVYDIGKILASPSLEKATRDIVATVITHVPGFTKADFDSLLGNDPAMIQAAGGLGARLTAMYETQTGRTALRPGDTKVQFDVTNSGLSYIGLDSLGKPELARLISTSVMQRMAVYAADRTNGKIRDTRPRFLIIDEANFVARKVLLNLLSRARSAGIATIVCTQGPTDWAAREAGEPDLTSLVQNCTVSLILRQGELTNAELCANIIGRRERAVMTQQVRDGVITETGSLSSTVDYIVSPDSLRSFTVGEAVLRVGSPEERVTYVRVARRDPKTVYRSGSTR